MNIKFTLNLIFVLLFASLTSTTLSQTYSLQQLLQISDTANPSVRNAKLDIEINGKQKNAYLAARFFYF